MEKENRNNNKTAILVAIIAVVAIVALTGGGTYAYWTWRSSTESGNSQRTDIIQNGGANDFVIAKPSFTITGTNATGKIIAPTASCYNSKYTLAGRATVSAVNNTGITMKATLTLKAKITLSQNFASNSERDAALAHLHFAVKKVAADNTAFAAGNCAGTNGAEFYKADFTSAAIASNPVDYTTTLTFNVSPSSNVTNYYQVYVWLDSTYTHENVGNVQSDPFQDMTVLVSFSESSTFAQVTS